MDLVPHTGLGGRRTIRSFDRLRLVLITLLLLRFGISLLLRRILLTLRLGGCVGVGRLLDWLVHSNRLRAGSIRFSVRALSSRKSYEGLLGISDLFVLILLILLIVVLIPALLLLVLSLAILSFNFFAVSFIGLGVAALNLFFGRRLHHGFNVKLSLLFSRRTIWV